MRVHLTKGDGIELSMNQCLKFKRKLNLWVAWHYTSGGLIHIPKHFNKLGVPSGCGQTCKRPQCTHRFISPCLHFYIYESASFNALYISGQHLHLGTFISYHVIGAFECTIYKIAFSPSARESEAVQFSRTKEGRKKPAQMVFIVLTEHPWKLFYQWIPFCGTVR